MDTIVHDIGVLQAELGDALDELRRRRKNLQSPRWLVSHHGGAVLWVGVITFAGGAFAWAIVLTRVRRRNRLRSRLFGAVRRTFQGISLRWSRLRAALRHERELELRKPGKGNGLGKKLVQRSISHVPGLFDVAVRRALARARATSSSRRAETERREAALLKRAD